jgi:hypothetical protein
MPSSPVTLVPGQTYFVELRIEPEDPVRLHARFTLGGSPLECSGAFRCQSFVVGGKSDPAGNLELELRRPGHWSALIWVHLSPEDPYDMVANDVRRLEVVVPDVDEHSLVLELEDCSRVRSMAELVR